GATRVLVGTDSRQHGNDSTGQRFRDGTQSLFLTGRRSPDILLTEKQTSTVFSNLDYRTNNINDRLDVKRMDDLLGQLDVSQMTETGRLGTSRTHEPVSTAQSRIENRPSVPLKIVGGLTFGLLKGAIDPNERR